MARLVFLALFLLSSPALAQERAGVVAMGGSDGIDPALWTSALAVFEQHLHDGGFEVDTGGTPRLPDGCHQECRDAERRSRELDVIGVLTLEGTGGEVTHVLVSVIDALAEYTQRETVGSRDLSLVAELAIVQALAQRERGRRPWISVMGTPEAAYVSIDGRDVGLVPWEGEVEAGEREVSVHLPGFETDTRTVTAAPGAPISIEVELAPAAASGSDDVRRVAGVGTGIPLVLAGLALTILGGTYATRAGECLDPSFCTTRYAFGDTEGVSLGLGISFTLAGATLIAIGAY